MNTVKVAEADFPTEFGNFRIFGFESSDKSDGAVALVMGNPTEAESSLVRIHSQCLTGDVFTSRRCDCGAIVMEREPIEAGTPAISPASMSQLSCQAW